MEIGIDIAASDAGLTAYCVRIDGEWVPFSLPQGGEWAFLPYRHDFIAVSAYHGVYHVRRYEGFSRPNLRIERLLSL